VIVRTLTVGPLEENAYLVVDETTRRAVLIDPGEEADRLLAAVKDERAELDAIWLTHAHMDHVGGIAGIVRATRAPIFVHPREQPIYDSAAQHGLVFGLRVEQPPPPDRTLADGDALHVGTLTFSVIHTPGHAPGHVVIHGNGVAFVGDCLFAGSIGRTDLPLADGAQLAQSLERICALPDETIVYPGHGPATSIGREKRTNPFLTGAVRITGLDR
jgi:glyoxylase-like metal-dependent hydrolase (beta-lactamase superfamily II)